MSAFYLLGLIVGLLGLGFLDWRLKLALFIRPKLTLLTILAGVMIFLVWDLIGIATGIFFSGHSSYMLGIYLLTDLPLEELFFLTLLCYVSLLLYKGYSRWQRI